MDGSERGNALYLCVLRDRLHVLINANPTYSGVQPRKEADMAEQGRPETSGKGLRGTTVYIICLGGAEGLFFLDFEGNPARGVRPPSAAARFTSYLEADAVNSTLRRLGYASVVSDVLGEPVDREALRNPVLSPKPRVPRDLADYETNFTAEEMMRSYRNPSEEYDEFRAAVDKILEGKFQ